MHLDQSVENYRQQREMQNEKSRNPAGQMEQLPFLPVCRIYFVNDQQDCIAEIQPEQKISHNRLLAYASRWTVSGENAGRQTAMYSAPPAWGVLYWTHSPASTTIACPAETSSSLSRRFTLSFPLRTTVYSLNSGVCAGSDQPSGLVILAILTSEVCEFALPMNSSICLGGMPAA